MRCYSQTFIITVNCPLSGPAPYEPASIHSHMKPSRAVYPTMYNVLFNINLVAFSL